MLDEITRAVLARDDVARYMKAGGHIDLQAKEKIHAYLDELRTTQRYPLYRRLKHPLYPILRKIARIPEHIEIVRKATAKGRVLYVSNHKSHLDYLIEPLVLEDTGVRPPIIAAGINLFGGPLGLIHRHVTGALPIRRDAKDPAYLVTLKAYVAELLQHRDMLFYLEGGRSYTGELKSAKTGLLHAALQADHRDEIVIVPTAIAYDLVLEDRILAHQGAKRRQRPFAREMAEMVGTAVGYRTRAFVTFGTPIPLHGWDPDSRRDVMALAQATRDAIGRQHKVLPTALVASVTRPSMRLADLVPRLTAVIEAVERAGANIEVTDPHLVVERGLRALEARGVTVRERNVVRVRDRMVLRYYAQTIAHLLHPATRPSRTH